MFCTKCGCELQEDAAFCSNCGNPIEKKNTCAKKQNKININKKFFIPIITIVVLISIILFLLNKPSEATLSRSENLLGVPCDKVLEDDEFSVVNIFGIKTARAETNDVFGVSGENVIFITEDTEYINIVTWQSDDDIELTESEIKSFVKKMKSVYGIPVESSEDSYVWQKKNYGVRMEINSDEIYIMWVNNE